MKRKGDNIERRRSLRTEAEDMVVGLSPEITEAHPADILIHELLVHKVELEIQNEELRRAHTAMEEARDRYADLYEFAPVSYITLNREGLISEINLTGSALLGVERTKLINRRFSQFVASENRDLWHRLSMNMMGHSKVEKQGFALEMSRADGTTFYAYLDCLRREPAGSPPMLRVALTDISKIRLVGKE
ncbi:PAS domain-containing protein [Methylococcus sp. EFPC2]|uniref:PAS domain-containing protein n=1 Tax=Methylococcus sp. EFPC2 TaxID=2812648 RepID=UPI00196762E7|nr:PAS domain-containing protein [Methylococcus sp. EFPC2]QSA97762.1 PAS domain-containing protein [Methylococcus sp. EFPC2]